MIVSLGIFDLCGPWCGSYQSFLYVQVKHALKGTHESKEFEYKCNSNKQ